MGDTLLLHTHTHTPTRTHSLSLCALICSVRIVLGFSFFLLIFIQLIFPYITGVNIYYITDFRFLPEDPSMSQNKTEVFVPEG